MRPDVLFTSLILITELSLRKGCSRFFLLDALLYGVAQIKFVGKISFFFFLSFAGKTSIISCHNFTLKGLLQKYTLVIFVMCTFKPLVSYRSFSFKLGRLGRLKSVCDKWTVCYPCHLNFSEHRENLGITFLPKLKWKILLQFSVICSKKYLSPGHQSFLWVFISTEYFFCWWWKYVFEFYLGRVM